MSARGWSFFLFYRSLQLYFIYFIFNIKIFFFYFPEKKRKILSLLFFISTNKFPISFSGGAKKEKKKQQNHNIFILYVRQTKKMENRERVPPSPSSDVICA